MTDFDLTPEPPEGATPLDMTRAMVRTVLAQPEHEHPVLLARLRVQLDELEKDGYHRLVLVYRTAINALLENTR